jgi:hypothetical protein
LTGYRELFQVLEVLAAYRTIENFASITADGVFVPEVPVYVNLDKRKIKIKGPNATDYTE